MTELTIEAPAEPVSPAPDAAAIEAAPPEAGEQVAAPAAPEAERTLPEIEHPIGPLRQSILDHFLDSDSPDQSMSQIKAGLSTVLPGTVGAAVRREWEQGRLLRVSPGVYRLAPAKPAEPSKPPPPPPPPTPDGEAIWLSALEAWAADPASWNEELGPPPNAPNNNVPQEIKLRFNDRLRKRAARRQEAEAAAAKRAAADAALRDQLIAATRGNFTPGPGIQDISPIKVALEIVPLDRVLSAIRWKVDKLCYPKNPTLTS
jgi:hypothetical protein